MKLNSVYSISQCTIFYFHFHKCFWILYLLFNYFISSFECLLLQILRLHQSNQNLNYYFLNQKLKLSFQLNFELFLIFLKCLQVFMCFKRSQYCPDYFICLTDHQCLIYDSLLFVALEEIKSANLLASVLTHTENSSGLLISCLSFLDLFSSIFVQDLLFIRYYCLFQGFQLSKASIFNNQMSSIRSVQHVNFKKYFMIIS